MGSRSVALVTTGMDLISSSVGSDGLALPDNRLPLDIPL